VTVEPRDIVGLVGVGAAVLFAALFARSCNRADSAESELRRVREAEALADAGLPPESPDTKALRAALEEEKAKNETFRKALADATDQIREATGKPPKVVEVVRYVTRPGEATGIPLPPTPTIIPSGTSGSPPSYSPCLVAPGNILRIDVSEATLETRAGNRIVTGSAACRRITPPPETVIYESRIETSLTKGEIPDEVATPATRPWIAGVVGSTSGKSWGVGPNLGYGGKRVIATLGGTFGSDSRAIGSLMVRF
jgi:hypothetical protein